MNAVLVNADLDDGSLLGNCDALGSRQHNMVEISVDSHPPSNRRSVAREGNEAVLAPAPSCQAAPAPCSERSSRGCMPPGTDVGSPGRREAHAHSAVPSFLRDGPGRSGADNASPPLPSPRVPHAAGPQREGASKAASPQLDELPVVVDIESTPPLDGTAAERLSQELRKKKDRARRGVAEAGVSAAGDDGAFPPSSGKRTRPVGVAGGSPREHCVSPTARRAGAAEGGIAIKEYSRSRRRRSLSNNAAPELVRGAGGECSEPAVCCSGQAGNVGQKQPIAEPAIGMDGGADRQGSPVAAGREHTGGRDGRKRDQGAAHDRPEVQPPTSPASGKRAARDGGCGSKAERCHLHSRVSSPQHHPHAYGNLASAHEHTRAPGAEGPDPVAGRTRAASGTRGGSLKGAEVIDLSQGHPEEEEEVWAPDGAAAHVFSMREDAGPAALSGFRGANGVLRSENHCDGTLNRWLTEDGSRGREPSGFSGPRQTSGEKAGGAVGHARGRESLSPAMNPHLLEPELGRRVGLAGRAAMQREIARKNAQAADARFASAQVDLHPEPHGRNASEASSGKRKRIPSIIGAVAQTEPVRVIDLTPAGAQSTSGNAHEPAPVGGADRGPGDALQGVPSHMWQDAKPKDPMYDDFTGGVGLAHSKAGKKIRNLLKPIHSRQPQPQPQHAMQDYGPMSNNGLCLNLSLGSAEEGRGP